MTKTVDDYIQYAALTRGFTGIVELFSTFSVGRINAVRSAVKSALDEPRPAMSEDEILQRARRAYSTLVSDDVRKRSITDGRHDDKAVVMSAIRALRDLDKPLTPPDPLEMLVDGYNQVGALAGVPRDALLAFARKVRDL